MNNNLPTSQNTVSSPEPAKTTPKKRFSVPSIKSAPPFQFSSWLGFFFGVILPTLGLIPLFWKQIHTPEFPLGGMTITLFLSLSILLMLLIGYAFWQLFEKKGFPRWIWLVLSVFYSTWITLCIIFFVNDYSINQIEPWLFISAMIMIPLFYSMIQIMLWLTPERGEQSFGKSMLSLVLVPIVWYLLVNLWIYSSNQSILSIVLLLTVVATYFFVFMLLRIIYLIARQKDSLWKKVRFVLIFIFPILAFAVTQLTPRFSFFWDYSSLLYYVLVILNGILLLVPEPKKQILRLLLFFARCVLYLIVTYFFIVISPFYTLSLLGILVAGIGLLVLSPLFLWVYQTRFLIDRAKDLFRDYGVIKTIAPALFGLAIVPLCLFVAFQSEKQNFQNAVALARAGMVQDVSDVSTPIDTKLLEETLKYFPQDYNYYSYRSQRPTPPMISQFHNRIVAIDEMFIGFDEHLEDINSGSTDEPLSNAEDVYSFHTSGVISDVLSLFSNTEIHRSEYDDYDYDYDYDYPQEELPPWVGNDILLQNFTVETVKEEDYYRSFVHLTLENTQEWDELQYDTTFDLPKGVFISDYYLDVFEERKSGILAEKSSANWIYDAVVSTRLDPGILNYDGNQVSLKVFPFSSLEIRYTGIEFLHKEPVTLSIDGQEIHLAPDASAITKPIETKNGVIYLSTKAKESLTPYERTPQYLFLVDCSYDTDVEQLVQQMEEFMKLEDISPEQASVTAINYQRQTWPMSDSNWQKNLLSFKREGQFAYGLAMKPMYERFDTPDSYPVFIVVQDNHDHVIRPNDLTFLEENIPELDGYYLLENSLSCLF